MNTKMSILFKELDEAQRTTSTGIVLRSVPDQTIPTRKAEQPKASLQVEPKPMIGIGKTVEHANMRIHRYAGSLVVTDLSTAGQRGKTTEEFVVYDIDFNTTPEAAKKIEDLEVFLSHRAKSFDQAKQIARKVVDTVAEQSMVKFSVRKLKSINVEPAANAAGSKVKIETTEFRLEASNVTFSVVQIPRKHEDTTNIMPPVRGGKKTAIAKFYQWVVANKAKIAHWSYAQLRDEMRRAKLDYHSYSTYD